VKTGKVSRLISRPSVYAFVPSAIVAPRSFSAAPVSSGVAQEFKKGRPSFPFFFPFLFFPPALPSLSISLFLSLSLSISLSLSFFSLRRSHSRPCVAFDEGCKSRSRTSKFKEPEPETVSFAALRSRILE